MAANPNVSEGKMTDVYYRNLSSTSHDEVTNIKAPSGYDSPSLRGLDSDTATGGDLAAYDMELLQFIDFYNQKQLGNNQFEKPVSGVGTKEISVNNDVAKCTSLFEFQYFCFSYHRSEAGSIRKDDYISNNEIAEFFEVLCDAVEKDSCKNQEIRFYNLSVSLQLRFLKVVCPRQSDGRADPECLAKLYDDVDKQTEFGVDITDYTENDKVILDTNMETYCNDIYSLSTDYHHGLCANSPSTPPSAYPSLDPAGLGGIEPTPPSTGPSSKPSIFRPTEFIYSREFTYMMGVNDTSVLAGIVGSGRTDILDSTKNAINRVLLIRAAKITETGKDQNGQDILMRIQNNGIDHTYKDEYVCTDAFVKSKYCIWFVSKVALVSSVECPQVEVNEAVFDTMKKSMDDESFVILVNRNARTNDDVKEVHYIQDGYMEPTSGKVQRPFPGWAIAVIIICVTLLCILCCVIVFCCFCRNRDAKEETKTRQIENDDLIISGRNLSDGGNDLDLYEEHFEDNDLAYIAAYQEKTNRDVYNEKTKRDMFSSSVKQNSFTNNKTQSVKKIIKTSEDILPDVRTSNLSSLESNKNGGTLSISNINSDVASSSGDSDLSPATLLKSIEQEEKLSEKLGEAIHAGDWSAVTAYATEELAQNDDISAMSSMQESGTGLSYDPSETKEDTFVESPR